MVPTKVIFRLKQSIYAHAKVIQKSCAKLAHASFGQIPEPVSKIITLNRVYKKVCKVNLQKKCAKLSASPSKYGAAWNTEK